MNGYLIDVRNGKHHEVEVSDRNPLHQYYDLIGCRCIDIAVRKVGGVDYNVVLDDEGLLIDKPVISAVDGSMRAMLAGNLIIFGFDESGFDLGPLTDEDVERIKANVHTVIDFDSMYETGDVKTYPVVVMAY